ncbi:hypothetical protein E0Z10_g9785 [Xylaria hypoxylon]|uniref:Uncharacterized protein n=1 Tax=Xylaria hypoxylon TaxID=37992 RepID=A0A4Z0YGA5_9PEZI|nr:hypothetical protein E0Z10_g9785 [Xylaria hypoxylon]
MWVRCLALFTAASLWTSTIAADVTVPGNETADIDSLKTWWHNTGETNYKTPVQGGNVRQSHVYLAWVKSTAESIDTYYNSFVYETIPRNGQGNIVIPGDPSSGTTTDDGVTIEAAVWITMAWTQFLYTSDAWVKISRRGSTANVTAADVIIRPSNLGLEVIDDGENNIYVFVPYSDAGVRFSVEFQDNLYTYRDSCNTTECEFVQDWVSDGPYYIPELTDDNAITGIEPRDALLIFASPPPSPTADFVPDRSVPETYVVYPGDVPVSDLASITNVNVYFMPGVHEMAATEHLMLSSSVNWRVQSKRRVSASSGEKYVYQANTAGGYTNMDSNGESLRIWSGHSTSGKQQTFTLTSWDYKQVGAFFGQTDGTTLYSGSNIHDVFYHSGDDTIKVYGSEITVRDPDGIEVIHMRYSSNGSHPSIIGANQVYEYAETETDTADPSLTVRNVTFQNIRAQGVGGNLMRIVPLTNYEGVLIENVSLEQFSVRTTGIYRSELPVWTDGSGQPISMSGFVISNFNVGGVQITQAANNHGPNDAGGLNIAYEYLADGSVTII